MKVFLAFLICSLSATVAFAGELIDLDIGQTLFTRDSAEQRIQTTEIEIVLSLEVQGVLPRYRIELHDLRTDQRAEKSFEQDPGELNLVAFNRDFYCDQSILFLTLRYAPTRYADVRQYRLETHAFHAHTLEYLDTALVAFEDIALQEVGVDFGWPYSAPQPYQVVCTTSSQEFKFDFVGSAVLP